MVRKARCGTMTAGEVCGSRMRMVANCPGLSSPLPLSTSASTVKVREAVVTLGDTRAGMELVKLLPGVRNAEVRTAVVFAVDHAVQKDTAAVADALQKLIEDKTAETSAALSSTAAEQVVYRLRAR